MSILFLLLCTSTGQSAHAEEQSPAPCAGLTGSLKAGQATAHYHYRANLKTRGIVAGLLKPFVAKLRNMDRFADLCFSEDRLSGKSFELTRQHLDCASTEIFWARYERRYRYRLTERYLALREGATFTDALEELVKVSAVEAGFFDWHDPNTNVVRSSEGILDETRKMGQRGEESLSSTSSYYYLADGTHWVWENGRPLRLVGEGDSLFQIFLSALPGSMGKLVLGSGDLYPLENKERVGLLPGWAKGAIRYPGPSEARIHYVSPLQRQESGTTHNPESPDTALSQVIDAWVGADLIYPIGGRPRAPIAIKLELRKWIRARAHFVMVTWWEAEAAL